MKNLFIVIFSSMLLLAGCSKENELRKSVMIYDSELKDLPAYSEWGYNTFGAYHDREVFISNSTVMPAKVIVSNNEMSFVLDGQKGSSYYYNNSDRMSLTLKMTGFAPENYSDLISLNDTTLDLTNPAFKVIVTMDTTKYTATILSGEFTFKRAQNLFVDKKEIEVILSGYFDFRTLINGLPVTISNGRFDVGISPDNFYFY
jgi:hypothetical protein